MIVEYMKHLVNGELVNPEWIVQGDFFPNPNDNTYVGIVTDNRSFYLPKTLKVMDRVSIQSRNLDIAFPNNTADNTQLTAAYEESVAWWNTYGE